MKKKLIMDNTQIVPTHRQLRTLFMEALRKDPKAKFMTREQAQAQGLSKADATAMISKIFATKKPETLA